MNLLFNIIGGKFKFQVQDSDFGIFFWRFEKHIALSEKKPPLNVPYFLLKGNCNHFCRFAILKVSFEKNGRVGKSHQKGNFF